MDTNFRKINVDLYDEDIFDPSELYSPDPRSPAEILQQAKGKAGMVRSMLAKGDAVGALEDAMTDPPFGEGNDEAKNLTLTAIVSILNSTKSTDITTILTSLSPDSRDWLMKYLYKGMGMPGWGDVSGSVLLGWHEKLTEVAGTGCIVRAMTDRRTV